MDKKSYFEKVRSAFRAGAEIRRDSGDMLIAYEEIFRWKWLATKLKMTSFVQYRPALGGEDFAKYANDCLGEAIRTSRGLPRGFQNGIVSFSVLACDNPSPDAIAFATARPKKHFSAFEVPILVDLSAERIYYYNGEMVWGAMYAHFLSSYLTSHFPPR